MNHLQVLLPSNSLTSSNHPLRISRILQRPEEDQAASPIVQSDVFLCLFNGFAHVCLFVFGLVLDH